MCLYILYPAFFFSLFVKNSRSGQTTVYLTLELPINKCLNRLSPYSGAEEKYLAVVHRAFPWAGQRVSTVHAAHAVLLSSLQMLGSLWRAVSAGAVQAAVEDGQGKHEPFLAEILDGYDAAAAMTARKIN